MSLLNKALVGDSIEGLWIGLHQDADDAVWVWTDGTDLDYPNWAPGQPQNQSDEKCGAAVEGSCSRLSV